jgi:hypothetical protein
MRESQTMQNNAGKTFGRARMLAIGFGLTMAIAACSGDKGPVDPTSPDTPVGSYSISTVNGKALPVALFDVQQPAPYKWEVMSGALNLTADGKFSSVVRYRQTITNNVSNFVDTTFGTWTRAADQVNLTNGQDPTEKVTGTWAGLQLTFIATDSMGTTTTVYKK